MSWQDIDQLTRIMLLVGKPSEALLEKMGSDEVREGRVSCSEEWCFSLLVFFSHNSSLVCLVLVSPLAVFLFAVSV